MADAGTLLVIDDEDAICGAFEKFFTNRGWRVFVCATATEGVETCRREQPDVIFLDIRLPDGSGLEKIDALLAESPGAAVIVITAYGSLDTVTRAMDGRAFDHLAKPLDLDHAERLAQRAIQNRRNRDRQQRVAAPSSNTAPSLIGSSQCMQDVYKRIGLVARSESSVLILGETGTGKELVARAIHEHSNRSGGPFVAVNCGGIPENLVENELFGHEKGAFTGAESTRKGRFEAADGGTLFLDEVGELSTAAQVKLLRALDLKTIERVGAVLPIQLDLRILAATNRSLDADTAAGRFREDLYHRLNVIHIELPPLRRRREDIQQLAANFLGRFGHAAGLKAETLQVLQKYRWPGNVRELENAMEHAAIVSAGTPILPEHLPESVTARGPALPGDDMTATLRDYVRSLRGTNEGIYKTAVRNLERELLIEAIDRAGGNRGTAAEILGIHRNTLRTKLGELGIGEGTAPLK